MSSEDDRQLDFAGVLAELHRLIGRAILVESSAEGRPAFQPARGVLAGAIDTQIDLPRSPELRAIIAFYLAGDGTLPATASTRNLRFATTSSAKPAPIRCRSRVAVGPATSRSC